MAKKILIIDDERTICGAVKCNLELSGDYKVFSELQSPQGLKAAQELKPDVILLDVVMPELNGYDIALKLKNNDITKNIPVIFITASVNLKESQTPEELNLDEYTILTKPITGPELIKAIEEHT